MTTLPPFLPANVIVLGLAAAITQVSCSNSANMPETETVTQALATDVTVMTVGETSTTANTGSPTDAATAKQVNYDGTLEAVKDASIAAQVAGVITQLHVQAGDSVQQGQVLARIDDSAATAQVVAAQAQVAQVQAQLNVAANELSRQKQLYAKNYISKAALERTQAQYQSVKAQLNALVAQTSSAKTQHGFFVLKAPFSGIVAQTFAVQGDMAMPGQPLLSLYQNQHLRVAVSLPQSIASQLDLSNPRAFYVTVPAINQNINHLLPVARAELLPMANAKAYSRTLRLYLDEQIAELVQHNGLTAGMAAKVGLPMVNQTNATTLTEGNTTDTTAIYVPISAVIRRGDLTGVYVLDSGKQHIRLRQVRLGQSLGNQIEVLSGLSKGDSIVIDASKATALATAGTQQTGA